MITANFSLVALYQYKAKENIRLNTFNQMQIIKAAIIQPFWNLDYKSMGQIVDSILLQQSNSIAAIRVLESDTKAGNLKYTVDRTGSNWVETSFEELKNNSDYMFWESGIVYKASQIGTVQVIFSIAEARQEIFQISFLLASALLFFSALCLFIFLTIHLRRVSKELQKEVDERTRQLDTQRMAMVNSSRLASLGEMSAGIAHEINNPLAVIDGTTRLIARQLEANLEIDVKKLDNYLSKISKMVSRITKIVNGLRAFSRDGSQEPITQFPIGKFFNDISDLCHASLLHKNVHMQFFADDPAVVLSGREVQLSQVLINIINNSADAVEHLDEKWINVDCVVEEEHVLIAITDSGKGIPEEIQTKMLQPFFTTKELGKGTGLGLSISLGIIESHGGSLTYCQNHKNTRFEIRLRKSLSNALSSAA
jgi:signal transduction histidine kinase